MSISPSLLRRCLPDNFLLALLATVALASVLPAQGRFTTVVDAISTITIMLLFFLHGVRLSREAVTSGVRHWRLHLTILSATFVLFPCLGLLLVGVAGPLLPAPLWTGVLFLCVLPSTVQSSIAFTSIARGNVAGAIAAATASNLIGIGLTPLLLGFLTQAHGASVPLSGVWKVVVQLLLPFAAGHLLRPVLGAWAARHKPLLTVTDRGTIVLAVYSAFSAAVLGGIWSGMAWSTLLTLFGMCALILGIVIVATRYGARLLGFDREDEIAIVFCGSKKTLASGVPMAKVLFAGPAMGPAVLPLMIFHQLQLVVCAGLSRRYASAEGGDPAADEAGATAR